MDWLTELLGFQSATQFGAQQVQLQNHHSLTLDCSTFFAPTPKGFESTSLAVVKDNLAVVPADWISSGVAKPWFLIKSHSALTDCLVGFRESSFVAFDEDFLSFIGRGAKIEMVHTFTGIDAQHVHEAPVYVPTTNELVFADTSVVGWLWALDIDTYKIRKLNTDPPLENVNGATMLDSNIYLTTNGGRAPAVWSCSVPTGHMLFTDPTYGWTQAWPGVGPPELPTAIYYFNMKTRAMITLDNDQVLQPNGLALSPDEKTLYIAESNSTSGKPINVWEDSVRNVYAFDFDEASLTLKNRRLVHVVESGWPDGVRVTKYGQRQLVLVACMGGVDVVDASKGGAGVMLGKWNIGDDIIFNLEPAVKDKNAAKWTKGPATWLMTGKKGVYKVTLASTT